MQEDKAITALTKEVAELKALICCMHESMQSLVAPAQQLNNSEKAKLILAAHNSGDKARVRAVNKIVNGEH